MKKLICFVIVVLFFDTGFLYAQHIQIKGRVITDGTLKPLPYAEISIMGKDVGTITNSEGNFVLSWGFTSLDSIIVTHLAYEKRIISLSDLKNVEDTIALVPKRIILGEVLVQGQDVVSLLRQALLNSKNSFGTPLRLETYYREFVKENQRFTKFSDGLLDYDVLGSIDKPKTKVHVKQSRANAIKTVADNETDWDLNSPLDVRKALDPFLLNKLEGIIENAGQYNFKMNAKKGENSNELVEIQFNSKNDTKELLYQGKVLIDKRSNYILSFSCSLEQNDDKPPKEINLILLKAQITQYSLLVMFRLKDGEYQPWYTNTHFGLNVWNKKKINETFSFLSDLQVSRVVKAPFDKISGKTEFKKKALYSLGTNYQSAFWEKQNTIPLTSEEENIIRQLQ